MSEEFDEVRVDAMLNEYENPAKILDTNWYAIKPMYEKKYRELIHDQDKFVSINDIRLSRDSVKKAIKYLREIYRHRIGKTKRSEEHTSELQSLMRISYAVFCLKKKIQQNQNTIHTIYR